MSTRFACVCNWRVCSASIVTCVDSSFVRVEERNERLVSLSILRSADCCRSVSMSITLKHTTKTVMKIAYSSTDVLLLCCGIAACESPVFGTLELLHERLEEPGSERHLAERVERDVDPCGIGLGECRVELVEGQARVHEGAYGRLRDEVEAGIEACDLHQLEAA